MTPPQQLHSNINDLLNVEGQRFSIYSLKQWTKLRAVTLSVRSPEVVGTGVTNGQVRNKISPEGGGGCRESLPVPAMVQGKHLDM